MKDSPEVDIKSLPAEEILRRVIQAVFTHPTISIEKSPRCDNKKPGVCKCPQCHLVNVLKTATEWLR